MCCMISRAIFSSFKLMSGVSQKYLFQHLEQKSVQIIYLIPEFSMMCGIICLATGYTLDVGEREVRMYLLILCVLCSPGVRGICRLNTLDLETRENAITGTKSWQ